LFFSYFVVVLSSSILCAILIGCRELQEAANAGRAGRYEVDGYVYSAEEEPKMLMTGKLPTL